MAKLNYCETWVAALPVRSLGVVNRDERFTQFKLREPYTASGGASQTYVAYVGGVSPGVLAVR